MTTQHMNDEQSDVDATVAKYPFVQESMVSSDEIPSPIVEETLEQLSSSAQPTDLSGEGQSETPLASETPLVREERQENVAETGMKEADVVEASMLGTDTMGKDGAAGKDVVEEKDGVEGKDAVEEKNGVEEKDEVGVDMTGTSPVTTLQPPLDDNMAVESAPVMPTSPTSSYDDVAAESVPAMTTTADAAEARENEAVAESAPTEPAPVLVEEQTTFTFTGEIPFGTGQEEVRSFTDFIEEFRQAEARLNGAFQESQESFSRLTPLASATGEVGAIHQAAAQSDTPNSLVSLSRADEVPTAEPPVAEEIEAPPATSQEQVIADSTPLQEVGETASEEMPTEPISAQSVTSLPPHPPVERPVSPLLRPATRLRVPRHGNTRQREEDLLAGETLPAPQSVSPAPVSQSAPVPIEAESEQPKPARRYRFDRPSTPSAPTSPAQQRVEENREKDQLNRSGFTTPARPENGQSSSGPVTETQPKQATNGSSPLPEQPLHKPQEPLTTEQADRRRYGQDRQQEQPPSALPTSQAVPVSPVPPATIPVAPEPEVVPPTQVPAAPQPEEIAPEDLPPLEYSELQKASSRRRRRHRAGTNNGASGAPAVSAPATPVAAKSATPEAAAPAAPQAATPPGGTPAAPTMPSPPTTTTRAPNNTIAASQPYNIVSGYTLNQMNQGNDLTGPFMGPDPSPARGSVSTRDGRTVRAEAHRAPVYPIRTPDAASSATSIQQLANVLSQAIQTQSDRMVAELRRTNQVPANISVSLPPFPSTERVGVFVDVANLLYSARTLRISIDFGKLLDFLRGNRRLVRAHAYCPTSPQPGDEQMFLQAVKGLGYRITTKNYKTFASGAKKADLDLDLCMDVVRLVEGRAVDCVVLVSGDSDFMPMLDYCSDHGVRVEVAAFDEAMSATLRQSCDLFINLSMLEEIRS